MERVLVATAAKIGLEDALARATRPQRQAILRVALRHVSAGLVAELDLMCRLQVLEGAAGLPSTGKWSQRPRQGLGAVQDHFRDAGIHPSWTSPSASGMYQSLHNFTARLLASANSTVFTADDILQNAIMGIGLDGERDTKRLFHEVGKEIAASIKKGTLTPEMVAKQNVWPALKKKALNEVNKIQRRQRITGPTVRDESETGGVGGFTQWNARFQGEVLTELMLDTRDPLGDQIRDFMRKTWQNKSYAAYMDEWLDVLERTGQKPRLNELATKFEVSPQAVSSGFQTAMENFRKQFARQPRLLDSLETRYRQEGITASKRVSSDPHPYLWVRNLCS